MVCALKTSIFFKGAVLLILCRYKCINGVIGYCIVGHTCSNLSVSLMTDKHVTEFTVDLLKINHQNQLKL